MFVQMQKSICLTWDAMRVRKIVISAYGIGMKKNDRFWAGGCVRKYVVVASIIWINHQLLRRANDQLVMRP